MDTSTGPCSRTDSSWDLWGQWLCPPVGQGAGLAVQPCQFFKSWGLRPVGRCPRISSWPACRCDWLFKSCDQDGAGLCVVAYLGLQPSHRCPLNTREGRLGWGSRQGHLGLPRKHICAQAVPGGSSWDHVPILGSVFWGSFGNFINLNILFLV